MFFTERANCTTNGLPGETSSTFTDMLNMLASNLSFIIPMCVHAHTESFISLSLHFVLLTGSVEQARKRFRAAEMIK